MSSWTILLEKQEMNKLPIIGIGIVVVTLLTTTIAHFDPLTNVRLFLGSLVIFLICLVIPVLTAKEG